MKKLFLIPIVVLLFNCSGDDNNNANNCNFLIDAGVNLEVNLNLPQFNQLMFPSNSVFVPNQGINGVWLWSLNSDTILAWEATDPSRPIESCSVLTETTTGIVESSCDQVNRYALASGGPLNGNTEPCTLRPYRVESLGNNVFLVTN